MLGKGGDLTLSRITCDTSPDETTSFINIDKDFTNLNIENCFFGPDCHMVFADEDLQKIIDKIKNSITTHNAKEVTGCLNSLTCLIENNPTYIFSLHKLGVIENLLASFQHFEDSVEVNIAAADLLKIISRIEQDDIISMLKTDKYNMVPFIIKALKRFPENSQLALRCSETIWSVVNFHYYQRHLKGPEIYEVLIESLDRHHKLPDPSSHILSCLWHCAHHVEKAKEYLLRGLKAILKAMDANQSDMKIQYEACGVLWNLGNHWTPEMTKEAFKRILPAIRTMQAETTSLSTALGMTLKLLKTSSDDDVKYLIDEGAINLLLELKGKYQAPEIEESLWKILTWLAKNNIARTELSFKISKRQKYAPISHLERVKIARSLTVQDDVDENVFKTLEKFLKKTSDPKVFFYCLDSVVHLTKNKNLSHHQDKIKNLGQILLQRAGPFAAKDEQVRNWIGWAEMYITQKQFPLPVVCVDVIKTVDFNVASDGLTIRHGFTGLFGSAIATHGVTKGCWYYEVTLYDGGFFQIGWANDKFLPDSDQGMGVGDDEHSWAIDLCRNAKWHKGSEISRQPYGDEHEQWKPGGVVQCYLDLDKKVMSFGYDGNDLGPAYDDFEIGNGLYPAISSNLENSCKFNFGSISFSYYSNSNFAPYQNCANN